MDREGDKIRRLIPNKPVRTPNHPKKSHMVLAKEGEKEKPTAIDESPLRPGTPRTSPRGRCQRHIGQIG